ncbi:MAG: GNAT family N-acetyltransferase [Candidatus Marinimicrobia bacterium]|nr:GNAT family N-acetyltransferase [Candidatus Neomarinimicrobiota bacterium]
MKKSEIIIKENCLEDAILVSQQIPEFEDAYPKSEHENNFKNIQHLILTAYVNNKPIGFKIGYETRTKQHFYSWMGGVLSKYRQLGIAEKLMEYQEQWAAQTGYIRILVKTRTKCKAMIKLLQKHGYIQIGIIPQSPDEETRILYEKKL